MRRFTRYSLAGRNAKLVHQGAHVGDRIVSYTHLDASTGEATAAAQAMNQSFGYDELGRLTSIVTPANSWTIGYDANGNRTSVKLNATTRTYTTASTSNRLTSVANPTRSFGYDAAGNTLSDTGLAYTTTYRLDNRLGTLTKNGLTTTYQYDAGGQRVHKEHSAGLRDFVYDQEGHLLGEYNASGVVQEFVWLGDLPVAVIVGSVASPLPLLAYADHLNAPRVLIDKSEAARWRWISEPFGTTQPEPAPAGLSPITFNLRFPGQYYDSESGLNYNYFRDYDGTTGRYVQSDPIGLDGGINTYAYAEGAPTSATDPLGLATYMCTQPLHALGKAGHVVYAPSYNPLYHQFIGIVREDGTVITGGQDRAAGPWGPGKPSAGDGAPGAGAQCTKVEDDNECLEQCLMSEFAKPRPKYALAISGLTNGGQNCQAWANSTIEQCQSSCKSKLMQQTPVYHGTPMGF